MSARCTTAKSAMKTQNGYSSQTDKIGLEREVKFFSRENNPET